LPRPSPAEDRVKEKRAMEIRGDRKGDREREKEG
jgi:hypothetical protein